MYQPTIPNTSAKKTFTRKEAINLPLNSIEVEEISLAPKVNTEEEKLQNIETLPDLTNADVNESVRELLELAKENELLLNSKLKQVSEIVEVLVRRVQIAQQDLEVGLVQLEPQVQPEKLTQQKQQEPLM